MVNLNQNELENVINFCKESICSNLDLPKNEFEATLLIAKNISFKEIILQCENRKQKMLKGE